MTDSNPTPLEPWHCLGSRRVPANRWGGLGECCECHKRMSIRTDGLAPKHPKPGMYHPNKQPHPTGKSAASLGAEQNARVLARVRAMALRWSEATTWDGQPATVVRAFGQELLMALAIHKSDAVTHE